MDAGKKLLKLLVERDPASPEFRSGVRAVLGSPETAELPSDVEPDLWRDVFVQQELPWGRFLQSALLHCTTVALLYTISLAWIRQQHILDHAALIDSALRHYFRTLLRLFDSLNHVSERFAAAPVFHFDVGISRAYGGVSLRLGRPRARSYAHQYDCDGSRSRRFSRSGWRS